MSITRREAILGLGAAGALCAVPAAASAERVVIEGVDRYRVVEPVFEGVRVIVTKRGERYSPAYVQGISGAAFRVAGPCPCAPTLPAV
jgi:S-adenosylhomocysteine hydrolase